MPCDTVQINRIDLPKMQPALRARALVAIGIDANQAKAGSFVHAGHWYRIERGELTSTTATRAQVEQTANLMKQAYSGEVVKYTAQRNGWTLKQTGAFQYEVQK